jgi:hypothetical protein
MIYRHPEELDEIDDDEEQKPPALPNQGVSINGQ